MALVTPFEVIPFCEIVRRGDSRAQENHGVFEEGPL